MHCVAVVQEALRLGEEGLNATDISRRIGVHRRTISDWLRGSVPRNGNPRTGTCDKCAGVHDVAEATEIYAYLLGLYLGDGNISAFPRGVYRLRITLDTKYPGIIRSAVQAIIGVGGGKTSVVRRSNQNCVDICSYWKGWACLFPQHGPGKKQDRTIALTEWQQDLVNRHPGELLRGLIESDGCRFINTGRGGWVCPRYTFHQVSGDIRRIFCDACERLGVHWTQAGKYTIYVSRKADVALLDTFIGPKR
jgi:hypothetical protein